MATEPVISVRGEAILEVEPEIAIVWVSVLARDKDRKRAVKLLRTGPRGSPPRSRTTAVRSKNWTAAW